MGGWPTTALLTPKGEVLTGGTYIPARRLLSLLTQVRDLYRRHKPELYARLLAMRESRRRDIIGRKMPSP